MWTYTCTDTVQFQNTHCFSLVADFNNGHKDQPCSSPDPSGLEGDEAQSLVFESNRHEEQDNKSSTAPDTVQRTTFASLMTSSSSATFTSSVAFSSSPAFSSSISFPSSATFSSTTFSSSPAVSSSSAALLTFQPPMTIITSITHSGFSHGSFSTLTESNSQTDNTVSQPTIQTSTSSPDKNSIKPSKSQPEEFTDIGSDHIGTTVESKGTSRINPDSITSTRRSLEASDQSTTPSKSFAATTSTSQVTQESGVRDSLSRISETKQTTTPHFNASQTTTPTTLYADSLPITLLQIKSLSYPDATQFRQLVGSQSSQKHHDKTISGAWQSTTFPSMDKPNSAGQSPVSDTKTRPPAVKPPKEPNMSDRSTRSLIVTTEASHSLDSLEDVASLALAQKATVSQPTGSVNGTRIITALQSHKEAINLSTTTSFPTDVRTLAAIAIPTSVTDLHSSPSTSHNPTETVSSVIGGAQIPPLFHPVSLGDYFLAAYVPVMITLPLAALAQILSMEVKALAPFHALSRPMGAAATDSLCLPTGGFPGIYKSICLCFRRQGRQPLLFLVDLLVWTTAIIASLSSEAFGIKLHGKCKHDDFRGCYMGIAVFGTQSRIIQSLLGFALCLILLIMYRLRNWQTGIDVPHGRSVAAISMLVTEACTRRVLQHLRPDSHTGRLSNKEMARQLEGYIFKLAPISSHLTGYKKLVSSRPTQALRKPKPQKTPTARRSRITEFVDHLPQGFLLQFLVILGTLSFIILIICYETITGADSPFEHFMNSQGFGVKLLFAGLGVVISLFWDDYFAQVALKEPDRQFNRWPRPAKTSSVFLVSPPTTAFAALTPATLHRRQFFLMWVAFVTVLSKITPLLLSNIPFSPWLTWETHRVCTWTAVGILTTMIFTLGYGLILVRYSRWPSHPGRLGGIIYYLLTMPSNSNGRTPILRFLDNGMAPGNHVEDIELGNIQSG
ncbi:hypothetical protein QC764_204580 [Podospora pseudoanserina]|uniref:Uncharacterized protein n=1 Tax=Podospora pseudoanserina TaxID=2609844 RepID=A0ABR0IGF1_9PEZI|nr:hypothetical protein QC764_204580 [Podospora pseudoanserina]